MGRRRLPFAEPSGGAVPRHTFSVCAGGSVEPEPETVIARTSPTSGWRSFAATCSTSALIDCAASVGADVLAPRAPVAPGPGAEP